jgi:hypothetical protein
MSKPITVLLIAVGMWLSSVLFGSPAFEGLIQKPVIYSYYWSISKGQKDLLNLNMKMPAITDIPWQDNPKWLEAKVYWKKRGKTILHRVYPFWGIKTEKNMYELFAKNLEKSKGIPIDEIVIAFFI